MRTLRSVSAAAATSASRGAASRSNRPRRRRRRGRMPRQEPLQYAGAGASRDMTPSTALPGGAGAQSVAATTGGIDSPAAAATWPAGFDVAAFTRQAKVNFVNMQAANDKRDLST